jgi:serralysin
MQDLTQDTHNASMPDFSQEEVVPDLHVDVPPGKQTQASIAALKERADNAPDPKAKGKLALAVARNRLWRTGRVLRVRFVDASATPMQIKLVMDAANEWTRYANLKFEVSSNKDAEIRITFQPQYICWSHIGTNALVIDYDAPTMTLGLFEGAKPRQDYRRYVLHEFGHAIGCIHEHQTPVAGIKWNLPVVYAYYERLCGWTEADVNHNVINVCAQASSNHPDERDKTPRGNDQPEAIYTPFDGQSIMVYAVPKTHTIDGFEVKWGFDLSQRDKEFIAAMYPQDAGHA